MASISPALTLCCVRLTLQAKWQNSMELAAYLEKPARAGYLTQIVCSDPAVAIVAPFGGSEPLFTPNPMEWGIPTSTDPVMIDISASTTTAGMSARLHATGRQGDHAWWLDAEGQPSNNPSVMFEDPPGSLQALGGMDAGHKGFGLALFVGAISSALAGYGRADGADTWGASVHVQVTDISAFGDASDFHAQTDHLVARCVNSKPADPAKPVRVPGQRGLALKAEQLKSGVALRADIVSALTELATQADIAMPVPV
uniref:Malate dehydrogenase (EC) n=1 Tax=uncultured Thiotrichaceae bacterium TaxID=298394 RepID=A0A6S6UP27_9GAMM|nr:MAG: Malate dehydrogenase (EC [uncultured Thiotrichaceae bacterium]